MVLVPGGAVALQSLESELRTHPQSPVGTSVRIDFHLRFESIKMIIQVMIDDE